jgi:gluconate kinase
MIEAESMKRHPKTSAPCLLVMFGLPGAGKTYVARQLTRFGFHVHDADDDLPQDMRSAIAHAMPVTVDMRDRFMSAVREHALQLTNRHPRVVIAQTFLKQIHRDAFVSLFPTALFVLVTAEQNLRITRLEQRTRQPLEPGYAHAMVTAFDPPVALFATIINNSDASCLQAQLEKLVARL